MGVTPETSSGGRFRFLPLARKEEVRDARREIGWTLSSCGWSYVIKPTRAAASDEVIYRTELTVCCSSAPSNGASVSARYVRASPVRPTSKSLRNLKTCVSPGRRKAFWSVSSRSS